MTVKTIALQDIRCMSFNIKNGYDAMEANGWESRKDMVPGMIRMHRADLIGVQEAFYSQIEDMQARLPEYKWVGAGRDDGHKEGEFACIWYLEERLEVLASGSFWLSEEPDTPGSRGWDAACNRVATWARFKDKLTDQSFFHLNTHFDHVGMVAIEESAKLILKRVHEAASDLPIIITGDFNCTSDSSPYRVLTGQQGGEGLPELRLHDAEAKASYHHFGPAFTFQGFDTKSLAAEMFPQYAEKSPQGLEFQSPIDFIFVNDKVAVKTYAILADHRQGTCPSDHFPIIADLAFTS